MAIPNLSKLLAQVTDIVERAGVLLSEEWSRAEGPRGQGDKAVVDVEIENILRPELLNLLSCDFWGEETERLFTGHAWCWVVDPNDGTSDFLKGLKGSAISVGLLCESIPVLGVVCAPITPEGLADCIGWAEGIPHLIRNGQSVNVRLADKQLSSGSTIMVSAAAVNKPELNRDLCAPGRFHAMPSIAYRLARVAADDGVCGISLYPVSAHDVVAGHALLRGAGGVLLDENGVTIRYSSEANMANVSKRCFGGSPSACYELAAREWDRVLYT
ncbi:inositol monophosphatase family protein [Pseudomonas umsongensis]|uniref:Inositol monophosphatase n=1 Tax=Pseudomonas umsongensis TaxID=198618 RepID=A0AAE7DGI3_9PSED|nr:inositol monophosphatase family protein [Pseudomonas umsongensis]QJC81566.1 inositol monophosphatase [Pseudomonas umsongensis]